MSIPAMLIGMIVWGRPISKNPPWRDAAVSIGAGILYVAVMAATGRFQINLYWLLVVAGIVGTYLLSYKRKSCQTIFLLCNLIWFGSNFAHDLFQQATVNLAFAVTNVYGIIEWSRPDRVRAD